MTAIAFTQPDTLWTSYYNDGYDNGNAGWSEQCYRLIQTQDDGFLIGGGTFTLAGNRQRLPAYYVVKTDADGVEEWTGVYDISRRHDILGGIAQGSNGQYFVAGGYQDGPWFANILKIDVNGDSLWSLDIENGDFYNVINTNNEDLLACGLFDNQLVKMTEDGEIVWSNRYVGGNCYSSDLIETEDNGYVSVGQIWPTVAWILKTSSDGDQEFLQFFDVDTVEDWFHCVIETPDRGYLAGGGSGQNSLLVKFDAHGNAIWTTGGVQGIRDRVRDIAPASNGGHVVVGGPTTQRGDNFTLTALRIDDLGEEVWELEVEFESDVHFEEATSVLALDDGGYLIGGNRWIRMDGGFSAGLIRTEPDTVRLPFVVQAITASHDFDSLEVDSSAFWECRLANFGRRTVMIDSVSFAGDSVFACPIDLPYNIEPEDTMIVPVMFQPTDDTTFAARLIFSFGNEQTLEVAVAGRGHLPNYIDSDFSRQPSIFSLSAAYPNPFNAITRLEFSLPEAGMVGIAVCDVAGRRIESVQRNFSAGSHAFIWNATNASAGIYFVTAAWNSAELTVELILVW